MQRWGACSAATAMELDHGLYSWALGWRHQQRSPDTSAAAVLQQLESPHLRCSCAAPAAAVTAPLRLCPCPASGQVAPFSRDQQCGGKGGKCGQESYMPCHEDSPTGALRPR
jgi:hypothetical protein